MSKQLSYQKEVRAAGQWHPMKNESGKPLIVRTQEEYADRINDNSGLTGIRLTLIESEAKEIVEQKQAKQLIHMTKVELLEKTDELGIEANDEETRKDLMQKIKAKVLENKE